MNEHPLSWRAVRYADVGYPHWDGYMVHVGDDDDPAVVCQHVVERETALLIAVAPDLYSTAQRLFEIVAEERECYFESRRNQATGEIPDVCQPYLERLDAALNAARAVFARVES